MAKSSRRVNTVYPEERDGRNKDANKKLKSQVKNLQKAVRQLESHNRTLNRAFNKSCEFIQSRLKDVSLEEVLKMINGFSYKENEKKPQQKILEKEEDQNFKLQTCPKCGKTSEEGFKVTSFDKFDVKMCSCGYRTKVNKSEGMERS